MLFPGALTPLMTEHRRTEDDWFGGQGLLLMSHKEGDSLVACKEEIHLTGHISSIGARRDRQ
jgi:hypothetical protein